jgi:protein-S-isoprenylcysteine O-methyltransferase Ste14
MSANTIFRLITIILFVTAFSVSIYYRRKAQLSSGDQINRRAEGGFIMIALRLSGLLLWLSVIAYIIYPPAIAWATITLPNWLRWIGVLGGFVAVGLLTWMFASLGLNITDSVVTRQKHSLVTHGPYRWIRHPLYTFGSFFFLCLSLISSLWIIPVLSIPAFAILIKRTATEEETLQARFGEEYLQYAQRTGRFLPRLG